MTLYSLKNITRKFGEREVLAIESLEIESGFIYGLLGPNGAGKSTLMKLLAFLDVPTSGKLSFNGQEVLPRVYGALRRQVVWVPQAPVMFTGSLRYNVEYPLRIRGQNRASRLAKADELMALAGLSHLANAPAHRLSGGEAQRASVARALATGAKVLLFDEPTANIDAASQVNFIKIVSDLWKKMEFSIIIATHDLELDGALCQKRIFLKDGRLASPNGLSGNIQGRLKTESGGLVLEVPKVAWANEAVFFVDGLANISGGLLLKLADADSRSFEVALGEDSAPAAVNLTLRCLIKVRTIGHN